RDQRDHFDFPVRGRGHGLELSRAVGDDPRARSVFVVLHRSGQPLLHPPEGGREGRQGASDAGRPGAEATAHRPHPLLQPAGARPDRAAVGDTLQKRLPSLLRLHAITTMEAANRWLAEVYIEQHNARFAVAAAEEGTAFIPFVGELDNILCIEEERVAGLDNTVRYEGRCLQIPPNRNRHHFAKSTIRVLEYWDGAIALFHGPREIARFHSDGTLNEKSKAKKEFVA